MMLRTVEMGRAEVADVPQDERSEVAAYVWQSVVHRIGMTKVAETFIVCDYLARYDPDEEVRLLEASGGSEEQLWELVMSRALRASSYDETRVKLFGEPMGDGPMRDQKH
jgi:hypothetical protein